MVYPFNAREATEASPGVPGTEVFVKSIVPVPVVSFESSVASNVSTSLDESPVLPEKLNEIALTESVRGDRPNPAADVKPHEDIVSV